MQGDVIGIWNAAGQEIVTYTYDPWGKVLSVTDDPLTNLGTINPFRYRTYYYDVETGLYYLNSRYYDPETGRFLNADTITDGGAGIIGNNLYAYAANNPINYSDPSGHWIIKNAIQWLAKNVIRPAVKKVQETLPKVFKGTYQRGRTASAALGVSGTVSLALACDGSGNIGISFSHGAGGGSGSAFIGEFQTWTNAPDIFNLRGYSAQIGGSADVYGIGVGAEATVFSPENSNIVYGGGTVMAGVGAPIPVEIHADVTYTKVFSVNIFNEFDSLYNRLMEW